MYCTIMPAELYGRLRATESTSSAWIRLIISGDTPNLQNFQNRSSYPDITVTALT
jgi:hypothetical protein